MGYEAIVVVTMVTIAATLFIIAKYINSIKKGMELGETSIVYAILHDEYINPLTRVHDALEDYSKAPDAFKASKHLDIDSMLYDTERLMNVAETLKMAIYFNPDKHVIQRVKVNLIEVIENIIEDLGDEAERSKVCIAMGEKEERTEDAPVNVIANKDALTYIFKNIIQNGIKYRDEKKENCKVTINVIKQKNEVIVSIKDNGMGMSINEIKALGECPSPISATRSLAGGNGYGHYFIKKALKLHRAKWNCESKKGDWTDVTVTLPVSRRRPRKRGPDL